MIRPDDSWYPTFDDEGCPIAPGVTVRLKLAAMAMQAIVTGIEISGDRPGKDYAESWIVDESYRLADATIERANRSKESNDGK